MDEAAIVRCVVYMHDRKWMFMNYCVNGDRVWRPKKTLHQQKKGLPIMNWLIFAHRKELNQRYHFLFYVFKIILLKTLWDYEVRDLGWKWFLCVSVVRQQQLYDINNNWIYFFNASRSHVCNWINFQGDGFNFVNDKSTHFSMSSPMGKRFL